VERWWWASRTHEFYKALLTSVINFSITTLIHCFLPHVQCYCTRQCHHMQ
jgi:hypothetical protein